jgi:hypothetical protein
MSSLNGTSPGCLFKLIVFVEYVSMMSPFNYASIMSSLHDAGNSWGRWGLGQSVHFTSKTTQRIPLKSDGKVLHSYRANLILGRARQISEEQSNSPLFLKMINMDCSTDLNETYVP